MIAEQREFGEVPLVRAMLSLGTKLSRTSPHPHHDDSYEMDFGLHSEGRRLWGHPAATYHHVREDSIVEMSLFEDGWECEHNTASPFRHNDVFKRRMGTTGVAAEQEEEWAGLQFDLDMCYDFGGF